MSGSAFTCRQARLNSMRNCCHQLLRGAGGAWREADASFRLLALSEARMRETPAAAGAPWLARSAAMRAREAASASGEEVSTAIWSIRYSAGFSPSGDGSPSACAANAKIEWLLYRLLVKWLAEHVGGTRGHLTELTGGDTNGPCCTTESEIPCYFCGVL